MLVAEAGFRDGAAVLVRSQAATEVKAAPVALVVTANPEPIGAFATITYEYRVSNRTSAPQNNLLLTAVASAIGIPVASQISGGGTCATACAGNVFVNWPAFSLDPGQAATFTLGAQANGARGTLVRDRATVGYPGGVVTRSLETAMN